MTTASFTDTILDVLRQHFGEHAEAILTASPLLGYLNSKTQSANRGSKARGAFANLYALYVVVEDYLSNGFLSGAATIPYSRYDGAKFSDLYRRQRELPFGAKLQNHALNSRLNGEFSKFYPTLEKLPIVRDTRRQRYWVQEDLLLVKLRHADRRDETYNIAEAIIEIVDRYAAAKMEAFEAFLATCRQIAALGETDPVQAVNFVVGQLQPNVDARVFEIVSYAVLKASYGQESVWIGDTKEDVDEEYLVLYKTGRTNANDGGIDFVMRPVGRFFQVTETVSASKYFLDIDKVQRFPITFVVKSTEAPEAIRAAIREQAVARYGIESVVDSYMDAVEEIINVDGLVEAFEHVVTSGHLPDVMHEIVAQSRVEFNFTSEMDDGSPDEVNVELFDED